MSDEPEVAESPVPCAHRYKKICPVCKPEVWSKTPEDGRISVDRFGRDREKGRHHG